MPKLKYGDKTAKILDNYVDNYKMPKGKTRTGIVAPVYDLYRNKNTMEKMKLKESDPFFHCKANYEATSRSGVYGAMIANVGNVIKEGHDIFIKKYPLGNSLQDYKANLKGQIGAFKGKTLKEACPTHHKKYK